MHKLAKWYLHCFSTCLQLQSSALQAAATTAAPVKAAAAASVKAAAPAVAPAVAPAAASSAVASSAAAAAITASETAAPSGASADAEAVAEVAAPQPAQPTPAVRMETAHKQLKSYLPGELCEAFRATGLKYDLYDWQVCTSQRIPFCVTETAASL